MFPIKIDRLLSCRAKPRFAATEAMEEAGVLEIIDPNPVGAFTYFKRRAGHFELIEVTAYALRVTCQLEEWPERAQRRVRWFRADEAAYLVQASHPLRPFRRSAPGRYP